MSRVPYLSARLQGFGTTVFAEMSALAVATGSVNLGQGFPDYPGPPEVLDVARAAIGTAADQYPPGPRHPGAAGGDRRAPAALRRAAPTTPTPRCWSPPAPPRRCRRALLALLDTGDEVVLFEPMYDCYAAGIAMAGGVARPGAAPPARPTAPGGGRSTRPSCGPRSRRAPGCCCSTPRTTPPARCSPPTSWPCSPATPIEHDLLVLTDEVYEHLVFERRRAPVDRHAARACASARSWSAARARRSTSPAGRSAGSAGRRRWSPPSAPPSSS